MARHYPNICTPPPPTEPPPRLTITYKFDLFFQNRIERNGYFYCGPQLLTDKP